MRRLVLIGLVMLAAGCPRQALPPQVLQQYQGRTLYTCCNIHYETAEISDADYFIGSTIPAGTPVQVDAMTSDSVTFTANGTKLTLNHRYGSAQESIQQYVDKVFVAEDPKGKLATFPRSAQDAIREGRVEKGMTREQVIMSLGFPPTHRTASTTSNEWTYWYNRWVSYKVQFDNQGLVASVVGRPAPTQDKPIEPDPPAPPPPARGKKRH